MAKLYHRASLINGHGHVSALCFKEPRAIVLSRASWTMRDEAVTCKKCQKKMAERSAASTVNGDA